MAKIIKYLKKNWILILILLTGAFFRLYKIESYMTFLGDEGRDAIIVRNLLVHFDPILIGPGTSVGNMYLGPLYYYFMAPFLFLSNYSPVGPAIGVALLGIVTIYLVFIVGKDWFGKTAGLIAALFFAISPTVIVYSHSSWNPNIMPFFSLLTIYAMWRVWKKNDYKFLYVMAISYAFVLQSHYLGLLLAPVIGIIWILKFLLLNTTTSTITEKTPLIKFIKSSVFAACVFLFLMSPLLIFDIRHNWMNYNAMKTFFTIRESTFSISPWSSFSKIPNIAIDIVSSLITGKNRILSQIVLAFVSIPSILILLGRKKLHSNEASGFSILFLWIIFGLIGFGLYKQPIYDHYYGFLFAAPFLLIGGFIQDVFENLSRIGRYLFILALLLLFYINIINNPLRSSPNNQMKRAENVANKVIEESKDQKFNIAVVAEQNYEDGYQYFLEKNNSKMIEIDAQFTETVTDQLFVICEKIKEQCDPTHSAKAEVANFGWSKIENEWNVDGVTIYKLIHTK
ncbi:MAG: glycosyltransferase family 39 protein [Candidatus Woesebacteria bacterium]|nr:glycosyltransferase family 39 protein [Candidatus Woesebacteria bacterium]